MSILLILLGLLPIMFMPEAFGNEAEDESGNGSSEDELDVLAPDTDDDIPPTVPIDIGDDPVLAPDDSDDSPEDFGNPVDEGAVLSPDEADDDESAFAQGESTLLQQVLRADPDATPDDQPVEPTTDIPSPDTQLGQLGEDDSEAALAASDDEDTGEDDEASDDEDADIVKPERDLNTVRAEQRDDDLIFEPAETTEPAADAQEESSENDTFWLYHNTGSDIAHAEISDFTPGEDLLQISLNPEVSTGTPDVSVQTSEDGKDSLVFVDDEMVAILQGTPNASAADINVDAPANIFG